MYLTDCAVPVRALALVPERIWVELGSVAHWGHIPAAQPLWEQPWAGGRGSPMAWLP